MITFHSVSPVSTVSMTETQLAVHKLLLQLVLLNLINLKTEIRLVLICFLIHKESTTAIHIFMFTFKCIRSYMHFMLILCIFVFQKFNIRACNSI